MYYEEIHAAIYVIYITLTLTLTLTVRVRVTNIVRVSMTNGVPMILYES